MPEYPLERVCKEEWTRKINSTYMFSSIAEEEGIPILQELIEIMQRLNTLPIEQTLVGEAVEYFFTQVFPQVSQKILSSKYFKSDIVLAYANQVLLEGVLLYLNYLPLADKFKSFAELITHIFSGDEYFRNNNTMNDTYAHQVVKIYAKVFCDKPHDFEWVSQVQVGDCIDILKLATYAGKASWSRGRVLAITETKLQIEYLYDYYNTTISVNKDSMDIAPLGTRSKIFEWRMALKAGDVIDCEDNFSGWYNATIVSIKNIDEQKPEITLREEEIFDDEDKSGTVNLDQLPTVVHSEERTISSEDKSQEGDVQTENDAQVEKEETTPSKELPKVRAYQGRKLALITFKVYDQRASKFDEKGRFYGFNDYTQRTDLTSPKIQPFCSVLKHWNYEQGKAVLDSDDINDAEFEYVNGGRVYALPRRRFASEFLFKAINEFGCKGGFTKPMQYLEENISYTVLCTYVKGLSGVAPYLHRGLAKELVTRLKPIIERHVFIDNEMSLKDFTKDRSQMLFTSLRILAKRNETIENVYEYENEKKMKLVNRCLQSQILKKKLQGLNELKDIVRTVTHSSERSRIIKNWVKQQNLFVKIYMTNSHVQLVKKSEEFFRYLIQESILQVGDLQRLYKLAQKGDYESRKSLYKLFQEVSYIFKKPHVDYLIDTILQSEQSLILNEDIDLLHEMSKFSNYFPREKVIRFFENIILGENQIPALREYATKKYSEIVAKASQMRAVRREIIRSFIARLETTQIIQVSKVLRGIFDGIAVGQWGRKDLSDILVQEKINDVALKAIRSHSGKPQFTVTVNEILGLLSFVYKQSSRVRISIKLFRGLYNELCEHPFLLKFFFKWCNQMLNCQQSFDDNESEEQFQELYKQLFTDEYFPTMGEDEFHLAKNLFLEINRKARYISFPTVHKGYEKTYTRKVSMKQLRLPQVPLKLVYGPEKGEIAEEALMFFLLLFNGRVNSSYEVNKFLEQLLGSLNDYHSRKQLAAVQRTLRLIDIVIDESEKKCDSNMECLLTTKNSENVKFILINDLSYMNDNRREEITVNLSMTLLEFKQLLGKKFTTPWHQIKIVGKSLIPEYLNARTIGELKLNPADPLTISKKYYSYSNEGDILIGNQLNPKAVRVIVKIFERYSTDGKMNRVQCHDFTSGCLNDYSKRHDDRVTTLFQTYDEDRDGLLELNDILKFFKLAAREKPAIVWLNLRNFGVNSEFKFMDEVELEKGPDKLPRRILAENQQFYKILFDLLHIENMASISFNILQRLPVPNFFYQKYFPNVSQQQSFDESIQTTIPAFFCEDDDAYMLFYKICVIDGINKSKCEEKRRWTAEFIKNCSTEKLYHILRRIMNDISKEESHIGVEIVNAGLNFMLNYLIGCFASVRHMSAILLLQIDMEIDDKIEYFATGSFQKAEQKMPQFVQPQKNIKWLGEPKAKMSSAMIQFAQSIWINWGASIANDTTKTSLTYSLLELICLLTLNEDPLPLTSALANFFKHVPSNKLARQMYTLILCLCLYSEQGQNKYINQLFKHITLPNITSEYFRMLAVLVAKFGLEEENVRGMPQLLLNNIMGEKNELTIEGCAKLLSNFNLNLSEKDVDSLWRDCLFGEHSSCRKESSRSAIYQLLLKVCASSQTITDRMIYLTIQTITPKLQLMKINYSTDVNQRSSTGYSGLKNLGNICYMNSMIQQLYFNSTFRHLLMRIDDRKEPQLVPDSKGNLVDDNLLHQIQRIFGYLEKTTRLDFVPSAFCVAYKPFGQSVNVMIQQDVQQFVSMFFDRLQSCIQDHPLKKAISDFYNGKSTNLFNCHACNQTRQVQQDFYSLSLQVKNSKSLAESFNLFSLGELIVDYKCDLCSKRADVSKKTVISKAPRVLTIHLKRIVFNLDTFINEKISTKHQFPQSFNLYPYTLQAEQKKIDSESKKSELESDLSKEHPQYQYQLMGIICHLGNAEMGHYISYIKTESGKWLEFNDSVVNVFNPTLIDAECFGGTLTYDQDYEWERRENSKSAYLLIYQKIVGGKIQMEVKTMEEKMMCLKEILLEEEIEELKNKKSKSVQKEVPQLGIADTKHEQSELTEPNNQGKSEQNEENETKEQSKREESEDEEPAEPSEEQRRERDSESIEQEQAIKHGEVSAVESTNTQVKLETEPQPQPQPQKIIVHIKNTLSPFMFPKLEAEISFDNQVHFFQKCMASPSFSKFFAKLLLLPHTHSQEMIRLCQKLTFSFWLKSSSFKELLTSLGFYIRNYPEGIKQLFVANQNITQLLIENMEVQVRSNIANFLATAFSDVIEIKKLDMLQQCDNGQQQANSICGVLAQLLSLLPTTVTRCWTKFSQYFQFWYQFALKGHIQCQYLLRQGILKHFVDYYLEKKSPLKIYANKPQIGSAYANPNFTMLLKTVETLLSFCYTHIRNNESFLHLLAPEERMLLLNFDFIEKLLSDHYETIAAGIVRIICRNSLHASEKVAVVLMRGFSRLGHQQIQPYLQVLHQFLLIEDDYQSIRIKWTLGRPHLNISTVSKSILAMQSTSLEERLYKFDSSLSVQQGTGLLEHILQFSRQSQSFCMIVLQQLMKLCKTSPYIRKYLWALPAPSFIAACYVDFFDELIERYLAETKRIMFHSPSMLNKEELAKTVKALYEEVLKLRKIDEEEQLVAVELQNIQNAPVTPEQTSKEVIFKEKSTVDQPKQHLQNSMESHSLAPPSTVPQQNPLQSSPANGSPPYDDAHRADSSGKSEDDVASNDRDKGDQDLQLQELEEDCEVLKSQKKNSSDKEWTVDPDYEVQCYNQTIRVGHPIDNAVQNKLIQKGELISSEDQMVFEEKQIDDQTGNIPHTFVEGPQEIQLEEIGYKKQSIENIGDLYEDAESNQRMEKKKKRKHKNKNKSKNVPVIDDMHQWEEDRRRRGNQADSPSKVVKEIFHPVMFRYHPVEIVPCSTNGVIITRHQSEIVKVPTQPTGMTNRVFVARGVGNKAAERLQASVWSRQIVEKVKGYFVANESDQSVRIETDQGCSLLRVCESIWLWSENVVRVFTFERAVEWPRWTVYPNQEVKPHPEGQRETEPPSLQE